MLRAMVSSVPVSRTFAILQTLCTAQDLMIAESPSKLSPRKLTSNATLVQLRDALANLGLDQQGKKETLVKRLSGAVKKATTNTMPETTTRSRRDQPMKAFLCFDVEATCITDKKLSWPNEVIEFPVVLLKWDDDPSFQPTHPSSPNGASRNNSTGSTNVDDQAKSTDGKATISGDSARHNGSTDARKSKAEKPKNITGAISEATLLNTIQSTFNEDATKNPAATFDLPEDTSSEPVGTLIDHPLNSDSSTPVRQLRVLSTFHSYVQPTWRRQLSEFCIGLTGIEQHQVDNSPKFPAVMRLLESWLDEHDLLDEEKHLVEGVCWVTDGPWDLRDFIAKQVFITPVSPYAHGYPPFLLPPYIDLKKAFQTVFSEQWYRDQTARVENAKDKDRSDPSHHEWHQQITTAGGGREGKKEGASVGGVGTSPGFYRTIVGQLEVAGLGEFSGRQHSGIADATNVARILADLARRDVILEPNGRLPPAANAKSFTWMGANPGDIIWDGPYE